MYTSLGLDESAHTFENDLRLKSWGSNTFSQNIWNRHVHFYRRNVLYRNIYEVYLPCHRILKCFKFVHQRFICDCRVPDEESIFNGVCASEEDSAGPETYCACHEEDDPTCGVSLDVNPCHQEDEVVTGQNLKLKGSDKLIAIVLMTPVNCVFFS